MSAPAEEPVQAEQPLNTEEKVEEKVVEQAQPEEAEAADAVAEAPAAAAAASEEATEEANPAKEEEKTETRRTFQSHSKYDASTLPATDDPKIMRNQVEFYFNDSNLPTDEHMWNLTGGPENKPVELKHMAEFKRMRRFTNYEALVAALKESTELEITGEPGAELIKRKVPYVKSADRTGLNKRSVYVKGFGEEEPTTQFDLEAFFAQYGDVNSVRLRRSQDDKLFKGSVFVEFHDEEGAQKFLALDPKPKWKDSDLKIMSKQAYVDEKKDLINAGQLEPQASHRRFYEGQGGKGSRGNSRGGRGGGKGGFHDKDNWKSRRDHDQKNGFRGGRGGRGRGRGGRGGRGRGGHGGPRDRDDRRDRQNGGQDKPRDDRNGGQPMIQSTNKDGEPVNAGKKHGRSDEGDSGERQAKKVDTKAEAAA